MLIDVDAVATSAARLSATRLRLAELGAEAVSRLESMGWTGSAAAVRSRLEAAGAATDAAASNLTIRADLAVAAEARLLTALSSGETTARGAWWELQAGAAWVERGRATPVDQARVEDAAGRVADLLSTGGVNLGLFSLGDTAVTEDDLLAIGGVLSTLSASELQALFRSLDDDQVTALVAEHYNGRGLPKRELLAYLEVLATGLTSGQLGGLLESLSGDGVELAGVIGRHASPSVAGLVMAGLGHAAIRDAGLREAMLALGRSIDGPVLDDVLVIGHAEGWLFEVLTASLGERIGSWSDGYSVSLSVRYDAGQTARMLEMIGLSSNDQLRADVFVAGVELLEGPLADAGRGFDASIGMSTAYSIENRPAALGALTALLLAAPLEMFDQLRLRADEDGDATTDYFRELLRDGRSGLSEEGGTAVNNLLRELLGGDPDGTDEFFLRREPVAGGDTDYRNAARLGYAMGTIARGLDALEPSADGEEELVGLIFGLVGLFDLPTKGPKFGFEVITYVAGEIDDRELERLRESADGFEDWVMQLVVPRDIGGNRLEVDAVDEFEDRYTFIVSQVPRVGD